MIVVVRNLLNLCATCNHYDRTIASDFDRPRKRPVAKLGRRNWLMRNSFLVWNQVSDSTTLTKREKCARNSPWLDLVERLLLGNKIWTASNLDPVEHFLSDCKLKLNNRFKKTVTATSPKKKKCRSRNPVPLNYNEYRAVFWCYNTLVSFYFCRFSNSDRMYAICSGVIPQHPPTSLTLSSPIHSLTKSSQYCFSSKSTRKG